MELNNMIKVTGEVKLTRSRNGIVDETTVHNIVTNIGLNRMLTMIANFSTNAPIDVYYNYISLGTGVTTPAVTDIAMTTITANSDRRCSYVISYDTTGLQFSSSWNTTDAIPITGTFKEIGLFDLSNSSVKYLWAHALIGTYVINSGDNITAQWTLRFSGI